MRKLIVGIALAFAATMSFASHELDVSSLSKEQKAKVQLQIAEMEKQSAEQQVASAIPKTPIPIAIREEATAWAKIGQNIGVGLVSAAKEVGMAANDFAQTPLGKLTSAVIIYKFIGKSIIGIIFGALLISAGTWFGVYIFNRITIDNIEYENIPRWNGIWVSTKKKVLRTTDGEAFFGGFLAAGVILLLSWGFGLSLVLI